MLARSIFIAGSLARSARVCCEPARVKYRCRGARSTAMRSNWRMATWRGCSSAWSTRTGASVPFTIDGEPVEAQEGDLLITAILLHRPALRRFEFGEGAARRLLPDGGLPGLLGAARRRAAPARLLDAGRAGHGGDHRRTRAVADPVVAIVGAGPAGVRAAETLARGGLRPILFDEARAAGRPDLPPAAEGRRTRRGRASTGSRRRRPPRIHRVLPDLARPDRLPAADARLERLPGPARSPRTGGLRRAALRPADPGDRRDGSGAALSRAGRCPACSRSAGRRSRSRRRAVAIGRRVALVGAGPLLPLVAHQYAKAGARRRRGARRDAVRCEAAQLPGCSRRARRRSPRGSGTRRATALQRARRVRYGVRAIRAEGSEQVEALRLSRRVGRRASHRIATRSAPRSACAARRSSPISPAAPSPSIRSAANGCRSARRRGARRVPGLYLAGDGAGIGGADVAELQGRRAALAVLEDLGRPVDAAETARLDRRACAAGALPQRARERLSVSGPPPRRRRRRARSLCRCEGITAGALREAARDEGRRRDEPRSRR